MSADVSFRTRAWNHGLTAPELRAFMDAHGHQCGICGLPENPSKRGGGLVIDHDHSCCPPLYPYRDGDRKRGCGKCLRGLLCHRCNSAIGQLREDPALFAKALEYLATPPLEFEVRPEHQRPHEGVTHHRANFNADQVRAIRARHAVGDITFEQLGRDYQVNAHTIARLVRRTSYSDVE